TEGPLHGGLVTPLRHHRHRAVAARTGPACGADYDGTRAPHARTPREHSSCSTNISTGTMAPAWGSQPPDGLVRSRREADRTLRPPGRAAVSRDWESRRLCRGPRAEVMPLQDQTGVRRSV